MTLLLQFISELILEMTYFSQKFQQSEVTNSSNESDSIYQLLYGKMISGCHWLW